MTTSPVTHHRPVVYYLSSVHGGVVKIGTTVNLGLRVARLRRAQPALQPVLLAVELGNEVLETQRHRQWATAHQQGEWFWLTPALQRHVDDLAEGNAVRLDLMRSMLKVTR